MRNYTVIIDDGTGDGEVFSGFDMNIGDASNPPECVAIVSNGEDSEVYAVDPTNDLRKFLEKYRRNAKIIGIFARDKAASPSYTAEDDLR